MERKLVAEWWRRAAAQVQQQGRKTQSKGNLLSEVNDGIIQATLVDQLPIRQRKIQLVLTDLKTCSKTRSLDWGKQVHAEAVECGYDSNIYVAGALISMYARCSSMVNARSVFESLEYPNVVCWTALILGYADNGQGHTGLHFFTRMTREGPAPDSVSLVAALKACASLSSNDCKNRVKEIHDLAVASSCMSDMHLQNTLIDMYAKCGDMEDARQIFDSMKNPSVVSLNALMLGYADNGQGFPALHLFTERTSKDIAPDSVTFVAALKACISLENASGWTDCIEDRCNIIHILAIEYGCYSNIYLQNSLIGIYAKHGKMVDACHVFNTMKNPDVVSWTSLIQGYADNGHELMALVTFTRMKREGPAPDARSFVSVLKACSALPLKQPRECRAWCKQTHNLVIDNGFYSNIYVQNTLIGMYAKCGSMVDARQVFDSMEHTDMVSWNALILGYTENGLAHTALDMFMNMRSKGPTPGSATFVATLKACISLALQGEWTECRNQGKEIHKLAIERSCDTNIVLQNTLIDMYAKCGSMVHARQVFDNMKHPNVISWTSLIIGYADNGQGWTALDLFTKMKSEGPALDSVAIVAGLKACTSLAFEGGTSLGAECMDRGRRIHKLAIENGCVNCYVQNCLIDMYSKCGSMLDARLVFNNMCTDVISWNALIMGYADNGESLAALEMFRKMKSGGPAPDSVTFVAALKACGLVGGLEFGREIQSEIRKVDVVLVTSLVTFYTKCGSLEEAQAVFDSYAETRVTITWNALLTGYATSGNHEYVFRLFNQMQDTGFQPDSVTFLCILTCCSHAGLLEKGKECFDIMSTKYGIAPDIEHYTCMVDIFGRANKLEDVMNLLKCTSPDDVTWMTVLDACRKWKNVEIGRLAFQSLINANDGDGAGYILMGHLYGSRGMFQEQEMVMEMRRKLKRLV